MRGGSRKGAGRPKKSKEEKVKYIIKTIKFRNEEKEILDYINNFFGNNFSEKLKNIIKEKLEKK